MFNILKYTENWGALQRKGTNKHTGAYSNVFLKEKKVNLCEHTVKTPSQESFWMVPKICDAIFTVCLHTFILFWLRKTSVIVEIFKIRFHVFVCAFFLEISSIFSKSFHFPFPYFVFSVLRCFPFHTDCYKFHLWSSKLPVAKNQQWKLVLSCQWEK